MISVIIPYMAIPPYNEQLEQILDDLEKQTAEHEVIVSEQEISRYINLNKLANEGFEKAKGEFIWHCDADFLLDDKTFLERMEKKIVDWDVIFPMFLSPLWKKWKFADGAAFGRKKTFEEYGKFDESLIGISHTRYPLIDWLLKNKNVYCTKEFTINLNLKPFVKPAREKRHEETTEKLKSLRVAVKKEIIKCGFRLKKTNH